MWKDRFHPKYRPTAKLTGHPSSSLAASSCYQPKAACPLTTQFQKFNANCP